MSVLHATVGITVCVDPSCHHLKEARRLRLELKLAKAHALDLKRQLHEAWEAAEKARPTATTTEEKRSSIEQLAHLPKPLLGCGIHTFAHADSPCSDCAALVAEAAP